MKLPGSFFITVIVVGYCSIGLLAQTPAPSTPGASVKVDQVINSVIDREKRTVQALSAYTPLVETYLQHLNLNEELGVVPTEDKYFLGKLSLKDGINQKSLLPLPGFAGKMKNILARLFTMRYLPNGFAQ